MDDTEVFKTCLEYWKYLTQDLYFSSKKEYPLLLSKGDNRKQIYSKVLSEVRLVMISKMAKPEEVIIVEDENGDLIKETLKDVDSIQLYKTMRETLIYLTHLDYEDTETIMIDKLQAQVEGVDWSWHNLNTLCWAIGSISGSMDEKDEKRFLVTVIKDLLNLCDIKKGKENKAVVASNIMYVVGQYPRFLMAHWKFLKTVVHKLFEFMHETFPGVQEMACDTFLKISVQCKRKFVQKHQQEERPFVEDILMDLGSIISLLESSHIQTFYEALGYMISCADNGKQEALVIKFMEIPNNRWSQIMQNASQNVSFLQNNDIMRELINLLKTNVAAAKSLGPCYIFQLKLIYRDMLQVYKVYSQMISSEVVKIGAKATAYSHVKGMRSVKKEALKLIESFILNTDNVEIVSKHFMPPLFEAILGDYQSSVPDARNPQVLSILAISIKQLKESLSNEIPKILENILECTLPMITKNFEDFPEHRILFFKLLQSINLYSFSSFFAIQEQGFKLVMNSILWAVKHTERNISETGLNMLKDFMTNIETTTSNESFINAFYQNWFSQILTDVFYVLTDQFHLSEFQVQSKILFHMFQIISKISVPIYDLKKYSNIKTNLSYVQQYTLDLISNSFKNLNQNMIQNFIMSLMNDNFEQFQNSLKDFLVEMKVFSPQDLNEEEKQQQLQKQLQMQKLVPGLIKEEQK